MEIGDRVVVNDQFGGYDNEPAVIVGFSRNLFGSPMVEVQLDHGGTTGFYPNELQLEQNG